MLRTRSELANITCHKHVTQFRQTTDRGCNYYLRLSVACKKEAISSELAISVLVVVRADRQLERAVDENGMFYAIR